MVVMREVASRTLSVTARAALVPPAQALKVS